MDPNTLLVVNVVNQLTLATVIPLVMGRRLGSAATSARRSMMVQGVGWGALALAATWKGHWQDWLLSSLAMACISASLWWLYRALEGWLGPRPMKRTLATICIAMPIGYALSFEGYPLRVGWANLLIAAQALVVARATLRPSGPLRGRWRWALFGCLLVMATLTAARGVLGGFFTELYPTFLAPSPVNLLALLAASTTLAIGDIAMMVAWHEESDAELHRQAETDALTGRLNRHGWNARAPKLIAQALRQGQLLCLLAIDLDHFKQINDRLGHAAGDEVLRAVGRVFAGCTRAGDLVARMGGEEFCLLLPGCDPDRARALDARLRVELAHESVISPGMAIRFSSGLAEFRQTDSLDALMSRADDALYRAKREGRDRLVTSL
ncbi:MAG: hypothetical protein RIS35_1028 [Pseudomonadota bacterium]|jgi:diguanylate cyclase (GGDEF)-like protein